jgi:hypothetical protein
MPVHNPEAEQGDDMGETRSSAGRGVWILAPVAGAFVAGFVGIAVFHQGSGWLFNKLGIYPAQYRTQPIPPFGVPQILSQCFWGGLWGIVLAWTLMHWRNVNYWLLTFLFGLIVPTLVGWFVVPPLKGTPLMGGPPWMIQAVRPLPNAIWGLGTAWLLKSLPNNFTWHR